MADTGRDARQALRRLLMFGFPSDARTLQQVPAVVQVRSIRSFTLRYFKP